MNEGSADFNLSRYFGIASGSGRSASCFPIGSPQSCTDYSVGLGTGQSKGKESTATAESHYAFSRPHGARSLPFDWCSSWSEVDLANMDGHLNCSCSGRGFDCQASG